MLQKKSILQINKVYTANAFQFSGDYYVGAGSETDPDVKLYNLTKETVVEVQGSPGGLMSFIPIPGQEGSYVTIQGLYPPFIGQDAGLFLHQTTEQEINTTKALGLPFAHRCEILSYQGMHYLVAATVSKYKEDPADWSRPGDLAVISLEDFSDIPWKSIAINAGITRNHGMTRAFFNGE